VLLRPTLGSVQVQQSGGMSKTAQRSADQARSIAEGATRTLVVFLWLLLGLILIGSAAGARNPRSNHS